MAARESSGGLARAGFAAQVGVEMHALMAELFPIYRSITGPGLRKTFEILRRYVPLEVTELPTGLPVLDWTIPREWNVSEAWIKTPDGRVIANFADCNLHVLGYSVPVRQTLSLEELRPHLYTLPEYPDWVPFRTSYWNEAWGFCLAHAELERLDDGLYEVCIDSTLEDGSLTYAEVVVPGESDEEVLFSAYSCHPALANDNLSGVAVLTFLARALLERPRRYTYRILLSPGTIGPIAWLSQNEEAVKRVHHGLVAVCLGDQGPMTYKRSRRGDAEIDRAVECVLRDSGDPHSLHDFVPWGGDERQFCSPGYNLAVGSLMRTPHAEFPEYHTSADNLDFVKPDKLADSLCRYLDVVEVLEENRTYVGTAPYGEPQLGRRGLYRSLSTGLLREHEVDERSLLWVLNLADGEHTLLDMALRSRLPFRVVCKAAAALREHELLAEVPR